MSILAKLRGETERLKAGRRVYVSSESVSAYKVANNKKKLLEGDHPFVLALPDDDSSSASSLSLLEASVGPELHWTLSSINHVLRTMSKYGEPTYLFANILDTDPQAFVAVTLNKRTPADELEHLEGVMSRVCNFHVADSKPMQVPGPDQVLGALGKGLMKLVLGGSGSSSSSKHKEHHSTSSSPPPRPTASSQQYSHGQYGQGQYSSQYEEPAKSPEQERAEYLASLDQRRGVHVAGVGAPSSHGYASGGHREEEGEDVPTAPVLPTGRTALGVGSKAVADARLEALKAEMRGQAGAPDLAPARDSTRPSAYPTIPSDDYTPTQTNPSWQSHTPGTLSNPFTGSSSTGGSTGAGTGYSAQAPDLSAPTPQQYSSRSSEGDRLGYGDYMNTSDVKTDTSPYTDAGWGPQGRVQVRDRPQGMSGPGYGDRVGQASDRSSYEKEQRRLRYEEEARQAREEWDRSLREAAARREAADSARGGKPRVRYHEVREDSGGWGRDQGQGQGQPAYAYAGGYGGQQQQGGEQQGSQEKKQQAPDWLEVLGKVFAGGPAYAGAPDL